MIEASDAAVEGDDLRAQVLRVAQAMHAAGLVVGTAGNVSMRGAGDVVCMTPSSLPYEGMTVDDLVLVDLAGDPLDATGRTPTTEKDLHLACYRRHPEVGGVVHTHPPYASMFAVAHEPIPAAIEEVVIHLGGAVPCGEYRTTGTIELGELVAAAVGDRSATLMANHGLVCIGRDADDALHASLVVERTAHIVWGARQIGTVHAIPAAVDEHFATAYRTARAGW